MPRDLEAFDRCSEQIAGGALDNILDESTEPSSIGLPLPASVVHELDVGWRVFVLARDQPCLRVGDRAAARQRQGEIAVGERGDDWRLRRWRHQDRLSGADRDADCARELFPEFTRGRMRVAPLLDVRFDLVVGAGIVWDDAAPRAHRPAESGGEFAPLPSCRSAARSRRPPAFAASCGRSHGMARSSCRRFAEGLIGDELPLLPGQPRQHHALDRGEVAGLELHAFAGTERCAGDVAE